MASINSAPRHYVKPTFLNGLRIQARVINGIVLRELAARFGKRGGGLFVTFFSAIFQSIAIALVRLVLGAPGYGGMAIFPFTACGLLFYRAFRDTASEETDCLQQNIGLLFFYHVSSLDLYLGRFVLSLALSLFVGFAVYYVTRAAGYSPAAQEPFYLLLLLILTNFMGLGYGLIISSVSIFFPTIKFINMVLMRVLMFASGIFFVVPELPLQLRPYLLWNPVLHITELARTYYFEQYNSPYGDIWYVLKCTGGMLVAGLVLQRICRNRVLE